MTKVQLQDLHLSTHQILQSQFPQDLVLLAALILDVLHHDRACSYPGLSLHSIGLLQVLNNLRSFKHGHTSIGILNVRNLKNIPFVYQLLPFRAVAGN